MVAVYIAIITLFVTNLAFLPYSGCSILSSKDHDRSTCRSRSEYNRILMKKLTDVENEIREKLQSIKEQILTCDEEDTVSNNCPEGWFRREKSCYFFSDVTARWETAMEACLKFGGYLAVITDAGENNFIKDLARRYRPKDELWIGGTDALREGEWRWSVTKEIISSSKFSDWQSGQPDNGSGNEHCIELKPYFSFRWNDDQCFHYQKYICEKDLQ